MYCSVIYTDVNIIYIHIFPLEDFQWFGHTAYFMFAFIIIMTDIHFEV